MTLLQHACADMVATQDQLQQLYRLQRACKVMRFPESPRLACTVATYRKTIQTMGQALAQYPAANDAVNLPGAA